MTNQEAAERLRNTLYMIRNFPGNLDAENQKEADADAEALETALRTLEPSRVICPAVKGQDCEGCPHGVEHDHGDCEALDGCPGCVEVKP